MKGVLYFGNFISRGRECKGARMQGGKKAPDAPLPPPPLSAPLGYYAWAYANLKLHVDVFIRI